MYVPLEDSPTNHQSRSFPLLLSLLGLSIITSCFFLVPHFYSSESSYLTVDPAARKYLKIQLENGLKVRVESDRGAVLSWAMMEVNSGSMSGDVPGLAHFVEHVLFIGSEKYPEEGFTHELPIDNGGFLNAGTSSEYTTFWVNAKPSAFNLTIDVFSGIFTNPIFPPSRVQAEVLAVNSEFELSYRSDAEREYRLTQVLANPAHPYSKFRCGNLESLGSVNNLTNTVERFREKHYVTGNMRLSLYGNHSVSELAKTAKALFSAVPPGPAPTTNRPSPLFPVTNQLILAPKLSEGHSINLLWAIPNNENIEDNPSLYFISYLITTPRSGGIREKLLNDNLILRIHAYQFEYLEDAAIYTISIDLTDYGFVHWENCLSLLFSYIDFLKSESEQRMGAAYVHFLANNHTSRYIENDRIRTKFAEAKPDIIPPFRPQNRERKTEFPKALNFLSTKSNLDMITKANAVGVFTSKRWNETKFMGENVTFSKREHYYDIEYEVYDMPDFEVKYEDFAVLWPEKLAVTMEDAVLTHCSNCSHAPILLHDSPTLSLWYSTGSMRKHLSRGILLRVITMNSCVANITSKVLALIPSAVNSYFSNAYESLRNELKSEAMVPSIHKAKSIMRRLILTNITLDEELIAESEDITLKEMSDFHRNVLERGTIRGVLIGDIEEKDGKLLALQIEKWGESRTVATFPPHRVKNFSGSYVFQRVLDFSVNHAIDNYYYLGPNTPSIAKAASLVLDKLISSKAFHVLRDEQQLGYIAYATVEPIHNELFLNVFVQGSYQPPHVMHQRITDFLRDFQGYLENMDESRIENVKDTVAYELTVVKEELTERIFRIITKVAKQEFDFSEDAVVAQFAVNVTRNDLVAIVKTARSEERSLSVQMYKAESQVEDIPGWETITDLDYFS